MAIKTEKTIDLTRVSKEFNAIKRPCITEKSTMLSEKNFYTFEVDKRANKFQIKENIEKKYNVHVELVRIISVPKKPKKRGGIKGFKSGYKKAIVKVMKGESIDITVN